MGSNGLSYPKASFNVKEMNPLVERAYWSGLPLAPLLHGIAEILMKHVDVDYPDAEACRVVRLADGEWHIDEGLTIAVYYPGAKNMDCIIRVQKKRPGKRTKTDYYQVPYADITARGKCLFVQRAVDDEDERWIITNLNNRQIAEAFSDDVWALQTELVQQLPGDEFDKLGPCPFTKALYGLNMKLGVEVSAGD